MHNTLTGTLDCAGVRVAVVNAPVADLPVRRALGGLHFIADLILPYGRVLHDYLAAKSARPQG